MIDERDPTPPTPNDPWIAYSRLGGARPPPSRSARQLSDQERLLALEMTDDHHAELHRTTAHRLEIGERRMSGHDMHIADLLQREKSREAAREARASERATIRAARNQAVQMAVWIAAILTCAVTLTNFIAPRVAPAPASLTAPAAR